MARRCLLRMLSGVFIVLDGIAPGNDDTTCRGHFFPIFPLVKSSVVFSRPSSCRRYIVTKTGADGKIDYAVVTCCQQNEEARGAYQHHVFL
jgi:hypothetical protein